MIVRYINVHLIIIIIIKHPVPDRVKPSFVIFDIRARHSDSDDVTVTSLRIGIDGNKEATYLVYGALFGRWRYSLYYLISIGL